MPALRYCSRSGDQKARIAQLAVGESLVASPAEAQVLRQAALRMRLRIRLKVLRKTEPATRLTLLGTHP